MEMKSSPWSSVVGRALLVFGVAMSVLTGRAAPVPDTFAPLRLGQVTPEGWLRAQLARELATGFHGNLDLLLQDKQTGEFLLDATTNDFVTRAKNQNCRRDAQGRTIPAAPRSWWHAEMVGDWYDSLIRAAFLVGDARAREKADRFVAALLKSQDADGYIGIYPAGFRYHFGSTDGELWTQRCAFLALLAYYEFTGRRDVLEAVQRAVKLTVRQYGPADNYFDNPQQTNAGVSHGLLFVDVLEWLHRLTGADEYARAALRLYDDYSAAKAVQNKDAQLGLLLDPKRPLGGHGPDIMGFLRVPLYSYHVSGNPRYRTAWENSLLKLDRHLGVGGSPLSGQREEIAAGDQTPNLPYEYCSTFYLMHSLIWAMQKQGDAKYGDMFERALFNAAQGARFGDGKALTYYSADERLWVRQKPPEGPSNPRFMYTAAYYPCCCHNSGARVYPYTIPALWMRSRGRDGDGVVATLYGPSRVTTEINGVAVTIVETTAYPFSFDIGLSISPEKPVSFPVRLRLPQWSAEPDITAPGARVARDPRGFVLLTKEWQRGDRIQLTLKPAIHGRKAVNGTTAIAYGPLVFSLPIPSQAEIVQRFPNAEAAGLKGFFGYQHDPVDVTAAKRPLTFRTGEPTDGFKVVTDAAADPMHPWDRSPLQLQGELVGSGGGAEPVTLLPMGCTILRRTFF